MGCASQIGVVVLESVSFLNARNPSIVTKLVSGESLHFFAFLLGGTGTCVTRYTSRAQNKNSGRVIGRPAAFTLTRKSKNAHTQYGFSGPNTQLRANYGVQPNYGPITGQLLGFAPNTQLFMLGQ